MFSVQEVGQLLQEKLPDDVDKIIIQSFRKNYIVMNVNLSRIGIFEALHNVCEMMSVDGVFTNDNCFHMIGDACYPWPSREINRTTLKAIRKTVRGMRYKISKQSLEIVREILEITCQFECSRFLCGIEAKEVSSLLVVGLELHELHISDLRYLVSTMSERKSSIKDVSFNNGRLELKISMYTEGDCGNRGTKRGRELEANADSKKTKVNF